MATQRDGEHTKARLRTEARDLYLDGGFGGFSLREVARRAGVSPAAVYRHFDDKEALLRDVCAAGFAIFSSYLLRALAARAPRERLTAAAEQGGATLLVRGVDPGWAAGRAISRRSRRRPVPARWRVAPPL